MRTREEIIEALNSIENEYSVDEWKVKDIHFWPVLKNIIFFIWHKQYIDSISPTIQHKTSFSPVKILLLRVSHSIKKMKGLINWSRLLSSIPKEKKDIIFCGAYSHRVLFEKKYSNRYFDPLIESHPGLRFSFVEYGTIPADKLKQYTVYPHFLLNQISSVVQLKGRQKMGMLQFSENQFSLAISKLARIVNHTENDIIRKLEAQLHRIEGYALFFEQLIQKQNPASMVGLCYYDPAMYGMNLAAVRMGVNSVDMQHGGMGNFHPAYSGFKKIPKSGYSLLPRKFWCWDEISAITLNSWIKNTHGKHSVVMGGNPWYVKALQNTRELNEKIQQAAKGKQIILYTLQYSYLDDYILNAIASLQEDHIWFLRMHPREIHKQTDIEQQLKAAGLFESVNIHEATVFPLPVLLLNSKVHVSKFSGSINEAFALHIPTVVMGKTGQEQFASIKDDRIVFFNENLEGSDLAALIKETANSNTKKTNTLVELKSQIEKVLSELSK